MTSLGTKKRLEKRNKPLKRISALFIIMFTLLGVNMIYFVVVQSDILILNSYNPRLSDIEKSTIRGDILDRNGKVLATTKIEDGENIRVYPYGSAFAHSIGFIGYGKTGIEAYSNIDLITTDSTIWEKLVANVSHTVPKGRSIITTFDAELQVLARELLGDNKGAIVAIEPSTGKLLAMVSTPDFDPNQIGQNYQEIVDNQEDAILLNRATQGLYPPGSTYKILTTITYLEKHKLDDFFYYCLGEAIIGQKKIHCYNSTVHGRLGLEEAFSKSCNTSYAHIGELISREDLRRVSEAFGYNHSIELEIESNNSQFVLNNESSKPEVSETVIGQGKTLVTPLNSALIVSTIANKGLLINPYIINKIIDTDGRIISEHISGNQSQIITSDMAEQIEAFMVTTSTSGTAKALKNDLYQIASKTGSAENPFGRAHAWYVGYAPVDKPEIAIAIVVENVGSSSVNAVPIAKKLYELYLTNP